MGGALGELLDQLQVRGQRCEREAILTAVPTPISQYFSTVEPHDIFHASVSGIVSVGPDFSSTVQSMNESRRPHFSRNFIGSRSIDGIAEKLGAPRTPD